MVTRKTSNDDELVLSHIDAMRQQEERHYRIGCNLLSSTLDDEKQRPSPGGRNALQQLEEEMIQRQIHLHCGNGDWRPRMAAWCFQIVDYCKVHREHVLVAMSYLDRYLFINKASNSTLPSLKQFQTLSMTCLYTAVKAHAPQVLTLDMISAFSKGAHTQQQIKDMEWELCTTLQWRLNPPTAIVYCRYLQSLVMPMGTIDFSMRIAVMDAAKYQLEFAALETDLVLVPASTVAYCAFLNALECLQHEDESVQPPDAALLQQIVNGLWHALFGYQQSSLSAAAPSDCEVERIRQLLYQPILQMPDEKKALILNTVTGNSIYNAAIAASSLSASSLLTNRRQQTTTATVVTTTVSPASAEQASAATTTTTTTTAVAIPVTPPTTTKQSPRSVAATETARRRRDAAAAVASSSYCHELLQEVHV